VPCPHHRSRRRSRGCPPERLPDHGRRQKCVTCAAGQRVDARSDRLAHRHRQLLAAHLGDRGCKLFEKEWIPAGDVDEPAGIDDGRAVTRHEPLGKRTSSVFRERLERHRRLRPEPRAPRRLDVEQLRTRGRHEQCGRVPRVLCEIPEQSELARVPPVHVLEDEDGRLRQGRALDEPSGGEQEQRTGGHLVVRRKSEEQEEMPKRLGGFVLRQQLAHRRLELWARGRGRIRLEDAAEVMHDSGERLIAGALLVGKAAPTQNPAAARVHERCDLTTEA
jgi:hypothetical protein